MLPLCANMLICCLHITAHTHAHHSLCPPAMHFIADCKQNCNSINKLNKNKYEYAASDFCLPLPPPLLLLHLPQAILIRMTTAPRPFAAPNPPANHIVCQISQAMTSFECMRFYASLLWFDFMAKF